MKHEFDNYTMLFQWLCMLMSTIAGIPVQFSKVVDRSMKGFFYYSLLAFCFCSIEFIDILIEFVDFDKEIYLLKIISIFIHFFFFSFFFLRLFLLSKAQKVLFYLIAVFTILLLFAASIDYQRGGGHLSFTVANSFLIYCCLTYYYYLFNQPPDTDILRMSSFWVVSGIFFSMSVSLPLFFIEQIGYLRENDDVFRYLIGIGGVFYGVFHLFLVKAYRCIMLKQDENGLVDAN